MQGYGMLLVWIDYAFASTSGLGGVSALEYGQRLVQMLPGVIAGSIVTVMYTKFAQQKIYEQGRKELLSSLVAAQRKGLMLLLPLTIFMSMSSDVIVNLVLNYGAFTDEAATTTAGVMSLYAPSIVFSFLTNIALAALYVDQNAPRIKITLIMVAVGLLSRALMNYYFVQQWGVLGISLAASLSGALVLLFIYPMMGRYWGPCLQKADKIEFIKTLSACTTLGLILFLAKPFLVFDFGGFPGLLAQLSALGTVAGITFIIAAWAFRSRDFLQATNKVLGKLKKVG